MLTRKSEAVLRVNNARSKRLQHVAIPNSVFFVSVLQCTAVSITQGSIPVQLCLVSTRVKLWSQLNEEEYSQIINRTGGLKIYYKVYVLGLLVVIETSVQFKTKRKHTVHVTRYKVGLKNLAILFPLFIRQGKLLVEIRKSDVNRCSQNLSILIINRSRQLHLKLLMFTFFLIAILYLLCIFCKNILYTFIKNTFYRVLNHQKLSVNVSAVFLILKLQVLSAKSFRTNKCSNNSEQPETILSILF